jgi:hypothetical protein
MKKRPLEVIARELRLALKRETKDIITIGDLLSEAKKQVDYGEWLPWLRDGFSLSERTAQRYIAASNFAAKYDTVADLDLSPSALYLVSGGEVPAKAVAAIMKEAAAKRVDVDRARAIAAPFLREQSDEAAKAEAKAAAAHRDEANELLDASPPELPPTQETSAPAVAAFRSTQDKFDDAVQTLIEVSTKPAVKFSRTRHTAADLQLVAAFLRQVADRLDAA